MSTVAASVRWAALVALLGGCEGARGCRAARPTGAAATPPVAAPASGDGGTRIMRTLAEIPPLGPSADGREVDVPIAWAYLLSEPSPTGSAPYAVVGATLPCGFAPAWTISTRAPATGPEGGGTVRLRMRARWQGPGEPSPAARTCASPPTAVQLVSLSVLRLGAWRVVDEIAHGPTDPALPEVVQHVVADDATLRPAAERWTRPCAADADCPGGVCAAVGGGRLCAPRTDPWRANGQACPGGTRAVSLRHGEGDAARTWEGCVAACGDGGACPGALRCDPVGVCLPGDRPVSPG